MFSFWNFPPSCFRTLYHIPCDHRAVVGEIGEWIVVGQSGNQCPVQPINQSVSQRSSCSLGVSVELSVGRSVDPSIMMVTSSSSPTYCKRCTSECHLFWVFKNLSQPVVTDGPSELNYVVPCCISCTRTLYFLFVRVSLSRKNDHLCIPYFLGVENSLSTFICSCGHRLRDRW